MSILNKQLNTVQNIIDAGLDADGLNRVFRIIGAPTYEVEMLNAFKLWTDYMPLSETHPYTTEQRFMHVLWESIDRVPLGSNLDFALPLRRMIAAKLFAGCGKNFICEGNVRFNFGPYMTVAGSPAKPMRERKTDGKRGMELNHYYFRGRMFQQD